MQPPALDFERIEVAGVGQEGVDLAAFEQRPEVPVEEGREVGAEEQRIAPAGAGVLHGGAIADGDGAVLQHQQHRHAFAGLADVAEARGDGLADIDEAVLPGALLDGLLVVEIERGIARNEMGLNNFHRGLPISLLLEMA